MKENKGRIVGALFLILIGLWFLAVQLSPQLEIFAYGAATWPWQIIGIGALFLIIGLLSWTPGLFIPGCIIGGIGGLLYYQNATGDWGSWAYAWTLIPGFVAVGLFLFGLLARRRGALIAAFWTLFASVLLYGIFGSTLGGGFQLAAIAWPAALILVGLYFIGRAFIRRPQ